MTTDPAVAATATLLSVSAAGDQLDDRYVWRAADLGVPARRNVGAVSFTGIDTPWLREAVKQWAQQRLTTGCAFNTIRAGTQALTRFSGFLNRCRPPVGRPTEMDRALLERYLAWLASLSLADSTKALFGVCERHAASAQRVRREEPNHRPALRDVHQLCRMPIGERTSRRSLPAFLAAELWRCLELFDVGALVTCGLAIEGEVCGTAGCAH